MIARGVNAPLASSCGRLFDAVAAALRLCRDRVQYEGQAAMQLEAAVERGQMEDDAAYPFTHSVAVRQRFFAENGLAVVRVAEAIAGFYRRNGNMLSMGNGGSSCDTSHFAVEFLHPVAAERPALTAVNLAATWRW